MHKVAKPEAWQRGPVDNIPALLQPVAHALLQAKEEVNELMIDFPEILLWSRPAGVASVGFHLQHLAGVLSRLFAYANGVFLDEEQLRHLSMEGTPAEIEGQQLVKQFNDQVARALVQLSTTDELSLNSSRGVGRAQISSTIIGLLFHAAEHTMRHVGQLHVTVKVVKASVP